MSTRLVGMDNTRIGLAPALHASASGHDATAVQPSSTRPAVLDGVSRCHDSEMLQPSSRPALSRVRTCRRTQALARVCARVCGWIHAYVPMGLDGWTDPVSMRVCAVQHSWTALDGWTAAGMPVLVTALRTGDRSAGGRALVGALAPTPPFAGPPRPGSIRGQRSAEFHCSIGFVLGVI